MESKYQKLHHNGLLLFKQFLDSSGYQKQYRIFEPSQSTDHQVQILNEFNTRKIKILLLHPEIIEGLSLKGASQVHFLEMPFNSLLKKQIIGRAVRYQSHVHLPPKK